MALRTSNTTVTFKRPFVLAGFSAALPAGSYCVETDEELMEGISFLACRRILALLHRPAMNRNTLHRRTLTIDPTALDAALRRDQVNSEIQVERDVSPTTPNGTTWPRRDETDSQAIDGGETAGMAAYPS